MEDKENVQDKPSAIPPGIEKRNSRESLKDISKVRIFYLFCWIIRYTDRDHAMSSAQMQMSSSPPMGSSRVFRSPHFPRNGHSLTASELRSWIVIFLSTKIPRSAIISSRWRSGTHNIPVMRLYPTKLCGLREARRLNHPKSSPARLRCGRR